ncbi:MAG: hypothetical protein ACI3V4_11385 [Faecousia sp.]
MGKYDKKSSAARGGGTPTPRVAQRDVSFELQSNPEFRKIASWLAGVKFKKKLFGGLDAVDVWKKIEELNRYYENALLAERVRYDLQLEQLSRDAAMNSILGSPELECNQDG